MTFSTGQRGVKKDSQNLFSNFLYLTLTRKITLEIDACSSMDIFSSLMKHGRFPTFLYDSIGSSVAVVEDLEA